MMATYFHGGPEIQAAAAAAGDHLQTLYLMNPNYLAAYNNNNNNNSNNNNNNNNQGGENMVIVNHGHGAHALIPHAPGSQQQLIGIPLSDHHGRASTSSDQIPSTLDGLAVSRVHYNLWNPSPAHPSPIPGSQGLSLSLSPHQLNPGGAVTVVGGGGDGRMSVTVAAGGGSSSVSNGVQGVILGSKYLKAAQELLDEVVNVGCFNKSENNNNGRDSCGSHKEKAKSLAATSDGGKASKKPAEQLSSAQRQEFQMKKAKLLNMLDEVEQRYRQYHTQMQVVVSSFEQVTRVGSAKSYTSLALQTISRQFRCLKDAITSQIKASSKSLGEEDTNGGGLGGKLEGGVGSRLKFVDHQLRQQRALQQLGMIQHNAWRPQRGLPERAVSVLRAWLFEHFLHPYPKDSDKHMLAKQTGLTRSQVSNWFINARVRLWKPMVEEMYTEEIKSQEQNNQNIDDITNTITSSSNNNNPTIVTPSNNNNDQSTSKTTTITTTQQPPPNHHHHHTTNDMISTMSATSSQGFTLIGSSSDMESLMGRSPKKQRSSSEIQQNSPSSILSMDMEMKPPDHQHHLHHDQRNSPMMGNNGSGLNPYYVHDISRFNQDQLATHHYPNNNNNGVSLTLGLPQNLGNHQQNFMSQGMQMGRRLDIGASEAEFCGISMGQPSHPSNNGYDTIDIQSRTRFAAHLLHDFVA